MNPAFALLGISWVLEKELPIPVTLREKLSVPSRHLWRALRALDANERKWLKAGITALAEAIEVPGPMRADELCQFVDSALDRPRARPRAKNVRSATTA